MTKISENKDGALILDVASKKEDLSPINNPLPEYARCRVCGRHISELKPFGGPGDPLDNDFTGKLLLRRYRIEGFIYDMEAKRAWEEVDEVMGTWEPNDLLSWFISKYGEEKGVRFYEAKNGWEEGCISSSWECRDCILLDDFECAKKFGRIIFRGEIPSQLPFDT